MKDTILEAQLRSHDILTAEDMSKEELIKKVASLESLLKSKDHVIALLETLEEGLSEDKRDLEDQINMGVETIRTLNNKVNELLKASDIQEVKHKEEMNDFYEICLGAIKDLGEIINDRE